MVCSHGRIHASALHVKRCLLELRSWIAGYSYSKVGEATGESRYLRFVSDWIDHFVQPDGSIRTYRMDEYNVDLINSGKLLFGAYERTGDERYRKAIELLREQMRTHPRNNANGFWHKQIYPYQMWLDGIYMAGPFLSEYALRFNETETFDDVVHQITLIEKHTAMRGQVCYIMPGTKANENAGVIQIRGCQNISGDAPSAGM